MKHTYATLFLTTLFFTPIAYGAEFEKSLKGIVYWVLENFVDVYLIPLLFSIIMLTFFWRNIVALFTREELAKKNDFKYYLLWAVVALTVAVSVWGILRLLTEVIGIENTVPQIKTIDTLNLGGNSGNSGGGGNEDTDPVTIPCMIARCGVACIGEPRSDCQP